MLPSFGWTEMLMIAIVLIVVIGPKDAISMMKSVSKSLKGFRQMAGDMQRQFNEALDEADLGEIKDVAKEMRQLDPRKQIKDAFKPLEDVGKEIADDFGDGADEIEAPATVTNEVDYSLNQAGAKMREAQADIKPKAIVSLDDAAEPAKPAAKKPNARKPATKKAPAKKSVAKKTAASSAGTTAPKKTAVKMPAVKKPATKTTARTRKAPAKAATNPATGDAA